MDASYVFRVRFRLDTGNVRADPDEFETVVRYPAADPGEEGWLFFRDNLWRGDVADESHLRERAIEWLGVPVVAISFSELRTDETHLDAFKEAIAADLDAFNAEVVTEVLHKYLGSSVRVIEE